MTPDSPVAARDAAVFARAVRALDWGKIHAQVTRFAFYRCKRREMAEDLAQEAIRRLIDSTTSAWDPAKDPAPAPLLFSIVNGLLQNERTSARARRDVPMTRKGRSGDEANDEVTRGRDFADESALSDEGFAASDLLARRLALLGSRLARDADATQVLGWMQEGDDTPAAICARSGKTLEQVIAIRKRIQRAAAQVVRDLDDGPLPSSEREDEPGARDDEPGARDDDESEEVA